MLIQISSGRGPEECELAVSLFVSALKKELDSYEILSMENGRYKDCCKSVLLRASMPVNLAEGSLLWISRSPFRPKHSRKNWFIGIRFIDEPEQCCYTAERDVVFQTFKSGGKGGQHVNKTESAVRAIHTATGLSTVSAGERSQYLNKKTALEQLKKLLTELKESNGAQLSDTLQYSHNNLVRGNPVRIYEGVSFKRIDV